MLFLGKVDKKPSMTSTTCDNDKNDTPAPLDENRATPNVSHSYLGDLLTDIYIPHRSMLQKVQITHKFIL